MRRRDLLFLMSLATAPPTSVSMAQPRQHLVGFLRLASPDEKQLADFRRGLNEAGYAEGRNLAIEYRFANGDYTRLHQLAADLVQKNVEVIITSGAPDTARAAMQATTKIPIVGTSVAPLVKHFNRPEANVTGVSILTGDLNSKRLQILAEMVPATTIGVFMNPAYHGYDLDRQTIENAGRALGVKLIFALASTDADLKSAFASLAAERVGAVFTEAEPFLGNRWQLLVPLAEQYAIPMLHEWRDAVAVGGLMSYAPSLAWVDEQVGRYTGQILNGAKPVDLPVVAPTKIELVINVKTANALGLTVPQSILARADEVIE